MKVGIISDTHGSVDIAHKVLREIKGLDLILHAGDLVTDAYRLDSLFDCEVITVAGNCDINPLEPSEKIVDLKAFKVLLTHGHLYRVKFGLNKLFLRAQELQVDVVVYGHTHQAQNLNHEGILFFNPGSITLPHQGPKTYGLLEIKGTDIESRIKSL